VKITKARLKQIIKEEFVAEMSAGPDIAGAVAALEEIESELGIMGGGSPGLEPRLDRNRSPEEAGTAQQASELLALVKKALHLLGAE